MDVFFHSLPYLLRAVSPNLEFSNCADRRLFLSSLTQCCGYRCMLLRLAFMLAWSSKLRSSCWLRQHLTSEPSLPPLTSFFETVSAYSPDGLGSHGLAISAFELQGYRCSLKCQQGGGNFPSQLFSYVYLSCAFLRNQKPELKKKCIQCSFEI